MARLPTKRALKEELLARLSDGCAAMERAQADTMAAATHPEAKAENDKDTRAIEQSYLARGQAKRLDTLRTALAEVREMPVAALGPAAPIAVGALVTLEQDDGERTLFLAPQGGGTRLAGGAVQVVTPQSPLGEALVGKRAGDGGEVVVAGGKREFEVVAVQ